MHIDFADKSTSKSISPKVSKYQFDTLNCSLEELAVLERVAQNPSIKQQELVSATGKSIATVKRIITSLQDKNYIRRENGKRYGKQSILFVLEFEGQSKLAIYHTKLMQTNWKPTESCTIEPRGLNLDKVWENIVVDIGGVSIADGNTLDEQIAADERRQKIEKEITKLEKQARAEKQPKKKFELVQQIKKLNTEMGKLK